MSGRDRRVSWLIPVRDGGTWLVEAVGSALADSGADDEVLVLDDGSKDGAPGLLPVDARLHVSTGPPLGIAAALERGRSLARGRWLARLDADDRSLPGRLFAQIAVLESDPKIAAVGGGVEWIERAQGLGMETYAAWLNGLSDPGREILVESPLAHPSVLLRAAALDAVGGWRQGPFPEDYDLWLRLVRGGWRLAKVDRCVVQLRDHPGRLTRSDPRYAEEAFEDCKREHLSSSILARPRTVAIWGGRRYGRRWARWMLEHGHRVAAIVDLGRERAWRGVPVLQPEGIGGIEADLWFVAVGRRGARDLIRAHLSTGRPDLVEGEDLWFLR